MKMAVLVYEYPPRIVGGLGTYAAEITRRFVLLGHDVSVFTMNDDAGGLPTREMWRGIEIHRPMHVDISDSMPGAVAEDMEKAGGSLQFFSKVLVYNCLSASTLINDLVRRAGFKYDIVIAHDWLSAIAGIAVKRELGLPLVFHVHSTERGRTLGDGSQVVSGIERRGGEVADLVVTVSQAMRGELIGLGFPEEKIRVCHNGVDPLKYSPREVSEERVREIRQRYGVGDDDLMALFVGRLTKVKGVDGLITAMPQVLKEVPNLKLAVVGLGEMQAQLEKLVQDLGLRETVKFRFEFIPEEERIAHYAACDLAVFPSLYEPFGIVALEAMSMGKPVVVGAEGVSGMRESVLSEGRDRCGFHVNPESPESIASGIIAAARDPARRERLGENGRRRVFREFNWDEIAKRTVRLYMEFLRGEGGAPEKGPP